MVKESVCNKGDQGLIPGLGRSSGEGPGNPSVYLPGESHGHRSLVDYSLCDCKELDMTEQLTHSHRWRRHQESKQVLKMENLYLLSHMEIESNLNHLTEVYI